MKILVINKYLYSRGGDAIVTLSTGELLQAYGHDVVFWGMKNPQNRTFPNTDLFIDEVDLNTGGGGVKGQLRIAGNMLYSLEAKRKVEELIKRTGKPDLVHLHNFAHQISPSVLHVFRKHNIPCVMTMHDYKLVCAAYSMLSKGAPCEKCAGGAYHQCFLTGCVKGSKAKSLLNTVEMYLHHKILNIYKYIDLFISPSRFLKDKVQSMGFDRPVEVLPNFINITDYQPRFEAGEQTICYIGRLSSEKGVPTLIEALKLLPQVHLKIIGDGPLRVELETKVTSSGMKNVSFLGHCSGDQLKEEIRTSRFAVCPSECYENNPRSVIETFALGKPVVGARIGGIPELVRDHETGLTFQHGNVTDLVEKITDLMAAPERCVAMGRRARQWAEQELTSDKHYDRLMCLYRRVLDSRK